MARVQVLADRECADHPVASAARTMWSSPGFWIFDESRVLIETPAAELAITQPRDIAVYLRTFNELAAVALYGSRARELISRAAADLR